MAFIGFKTSASGVSISAPDQIALTSGYAQPGLGAATYLYDPLVDAAFVAAHPEAAFLAADGRGFRLDELSPSAQMFGAVGDGVTDDRAAIVAAIAWTSRLGLELAIQGQLRVSATITVSSGLPVALRGSGLQAAEIIFNQGAGLIYDGGTPVEHDYATIALRDLGLRVTGGISVQAPLTVSATGGKGSTAIGLVMDNVDISGQTLADGFETAIYLVNARNVALTNVRILGDKSNGENVLSVHGVRMVSDLASEATELNMTNCEVYFVQTALELEGTFEGAYISNCTFAAVRTGINSFRDDGGDPFIGVYGCHFAALDYGVRARNRFQSFITGCLFYAMGNGLSTCVDLVSEVGPTLNWQIVGNTFKGEERYPPTNKTGIRINGGVVLPGGDKTSTLEANQFERLQDGIILGSAASFVTVGPTNTYTAVGVPVTNSGPGNRIHHPLIGGPNSPEGFATAEAASLYLQSNGYVWLKTTATGSSGWRIMSSSGAGALASGTTPSVANMPTTVRMQYPSPTTVANFLDGVDGWLYTFYFDNGNVTLQNGSGLFLKGGLSVTPLGGRIITLLYIGGFWIEQTRNF